MNVIHYTTTDENGNEQEDSILVSLNDMVNRKRSFTMTDEDGIETEYHILFSFDSSENGKYYVVYTDDSTDDEGNTEIFASVLESNSDGEFLSPIETEKEWEVVEIILKALQEMSQE